MEVIQAPLLDPLFRIPLAAGLICALLLPLLGSLLHLQDEGLSALGLACLAWATGLGGLAAGIPLVLGAPVGALAGALIRHLWEDRGYTITAFMIFIGWAAAASLSASAAPGLGILEGPLFLAGPLELGAAAAVAFAGLLALPRLLPRLVHARLFPAQDLANGKPVARWRLSFDILVALHLAVGAATLGVVESFALTMIPPWVAFRVAPSWRWTLVLAAALGGLVYVAAFGLALRAEQPFGPILVALLITAAGAAALVAPGRPRAQPKDPG